MAAIRCIVVAGALLTAPGSAWGQAGSVDVFAGGGIGFPGSRYPRKSDFKSATQGVTVWVSDLWGIGLWHSAWFDRRGETVHDVAPAIRWKFAREGEPLSLELGIRPIMFANAWNDLAVPFLPDPTADLFIGYKYRRSSSWRIQAGGFWFGTAFLPSLGITWTFRQGP